MDSVCIFLRYVSAKLKTLSHFVVGITRKFSFNLIRFIALSSVIFLQLSRAQGATYPLPLNDSDLVGKIKYITARESDTLVDIARRFDLGFNEVTAANPTVDPWLPGKGTRILLPTRFILPQAPREGVVVNIAEMRLYYFPLTENGLHKVVITYPIGIGREGWATPIGKFKVIDKIVKPSWTAPPSIIAEYASQGIQRDRIVPPGPDNPLGDYALTLNEPGYFIHGTNKPFSIGRRVSHGCLRLYPEDIDQLFKKIPRDTAVRIVNQPYKAGLENGILFLEAHEPINDTDPTGINLTPVVSVVIAATKFKLGNSSWEKATSVATRHSGIPTPIANTTSVAKK